MRLPIDFYYIPTSVFIILLTCKKKNPKIIFVTDEKQSSSMNKEHLTQG